jgi:hypothetical protein
MCVRVRAQLQERLRPDWRAMLLAVDGHRTADAARQLQRLPADATHLKADAPRQALSTGPRHRRRRRSRMGLTCVYGSDILRGNHLSPFGEEERAMFRGAMALGALNHTYTHAVAVRPAVAHFIGRGILARVPMCRRAVLSPRLPC